MALAVFDSSGLVIRAGICVLTIAPAGLLMGFGFPTGMRLISAVDRRPTPWFWGINGAAGVMAAAIAAASSIAFGIGTTFVLGALCYLLLVPAALVVRFPSADPASARRAPSTGVRRTPHRHQRNYESDGEGLPQASVNTKGRKRYDLHEHGNAIADEEVRRRNSL